MHQLKKSILSEVHIIVNNNMLNNISKPDTTTYLQKHLDSLMGKTYFLREELKKKNDPFKQKRFIKTKKLLCKIRKRQEVYSLLNVRNEELIVNDNVGVEIDLPDNSSENNNGNNNSGTEENLAENCGDSNNRDGNKTDVLSLKNQSKEKS